MPCQHITWNHRHEILVTSWAQPKLTPTIYVTARDDKAKIACNFFFFQSAHSISLVKERGCGGTFGSIFKICNIYTHTD